MIRRVLPCGLFIKQVEHFVGHVGDYAVRADVAQAFYLLRVVNGPVLNGYAVLVAVANEPLRSGAQNLELVRGNLNRFEAEFLFLYCKAVACSLLK